MALTEKGKLPPQNIEAEQSVLGGVLLDNSAVHKILDLLSQEDFYREAHRKIFNGIIKLVGRNDPVDLVTLTDELKNQGILEQVGGASFIASLLNSTPTAANITHYAKIVKEKSIRRRMISAATDVVSFGFEEASALEEYLDSSEAKIFEVTNQTARPSFVPLKEIVKESFKTIESLYERKELVTGVPSGFEEFDRLTSGFQPSDLIVVAGRPSMGKTSLMLAMAQNSAIQTKVPIAIFSLEMSKEQLVMRMLTSLAKVDASRLRIGKLNDNDWPKLTRAAGFLSEAPIFIDDTPAITLLEMRSKCRRLKAEHDLGLVVVDYLQLMNPTGHRESREREISDISRGLKALAKELHIPILAASQLNRGVEQRMDKRPMLSDLRECVTGDTLVILADGRRVPIQSLVGQTPIVMSMAGDGRISPAKSDLIWSVGKRKIFEIKVKNGKKIQAT